MPVCSDAHLYAHWFLNDDELGLLKGKGGSGRLILCILLKHYQLHGYFPKRLTQIPEAVIDFLAEQIGSPVDVLDLTSLGEVRAFLGIRRLDQVGRSAFRTWVRKSLLPEAPGAPAQDALIGDWFVKNRFERPSAGRLARLFGAAERAFECDLFQTVVGRLSPDHCARLEHLLETATSISHFSFLRSDPGAVSLKNVLKAIDRLSLLRNLALPEDLLNGLHPRLVERMRSRAGSEDVWEMRRHPGTIRLAFLCFFCAPRQAEVIDSLVDLLIGVTHKISARAEQKVVTELVREVMQVQGKTTMLFRIAEAAQRAPNGTVRKVIFPIVGERTLDDLVKEYHNNGPAYVKRIYRRVRSSYAQHYRRMLPPILATLTFRSNNAVWRPVLDGIAAIKIRTSSKARFFSIDDVPIKGVVEQKWRDIVIEEAADGSKRINRINYEICLLHSLRKALRTKEIWVCGAKRFCNPDHDLPADFDVRRASYYAALNQPVDVTTFINDIKDHMEAALSAFNTHLPNDPLVRIKQRGKIRLSITPFAPLPEPPNLDALKEELARRWPSTSLLDVLKETDFQAGFAKAFASSASRQALEPKEVTRRLLLALYGLGTNIGLKALAGEPNGVSYKELLHIRRRYIQKDSLRQAIRMVVNATFQARSLSVWGSGTTSCASDSTKFGAWDQNLMTEWHQRYGGRGVMIYWHVDAKATCIHSQLKRCSSSEVAAMIEGVLHHGTEMGVDRQYVDTHGQSLIAFAFCYLLGFELMPRLKQINRQKLFRPASKTATTYPHLEPIFAPSPIRWDVITPYYDEMIKLAIALLQRTAEPEAILRRFTRGQNHHPVYTALLELGKAVKTIFLCKYLGSEELRREINAGLNVVERWNGVNSFIYFGKGSEFTTNRVEDQEISALSLHLLQACLVHVNTLMIQEILDEQAWQARMTPRDMAALSPLPHAHFNPYGRFDLDMNARLPLAQMELAA